MPALSLPLSDTLGHALGGAWRRRRRPASSAAAPDNMSHGKAVSGTLPRPSARRRQCSVQPWLVAAGRQSHVRYDPPGSKRGGVSGTPPSPPYRVVAASRSEHWVKVDGGGVAACRGFAAERLGHGPDVVRAAPAADTDVADARVRAPSERIGHLEPGAGERLELIGNARPPSGVVSDSKAGVASEV